MLSKSPFGSQLLAYWRTFHEYTGNRILLYIGISLLVTLTEGFGITVFFPVLMQISGSSPSGPPPLHLRAVQSVFDMFGLPMDLTVLLAVILTVFVLKGVLLFLAGAYQSAVTARFLSVLSSRLLRAYSEMDYRFYLTTNVGTLTNLATNDANRAMVAFGKFASLFPPLITVTIFSMIAIALNWRMTLISIGFGFALVLVLRAVARLAQRYSRRNTEAYGALSSLLVQALAGFKYLAATASFPPLRARLDSAISTLSRTQFKLSLTACLTQAVSEPAVVILTCGLIWYQAAHLGRPVSEALVLILFFYRLMKEILAFQSGWHAFSATMGSIDLVARSIRETERSREPQGTRQAAGILEAIRFRDVTFSYKDKSVLKDVTLEIPRNRTVAFIGESGAGKSTLVDLISGLLRPDSGELLLDGVPYRELDLGQLRAKVGYVTQDSALFDDTVLNNIVLWDWSRGEKTTRDKARRVAELAGCSSFIDAMPQGFDTTIGDRGIKLSGGQKQRLSIARELFKEPALLILDEATSALDTETERDIQASLDRLKGSLTLIVIAHRISTVRNADMIYVLGNGGLLERGTFLELSHRKDSQFRRLCELQNLV
jgi:subfamily B ATP-binding cassette protein MsbA